MVLIYSAEIIYLFKSIGIFLRKHTKSIGTYAGEYDKNIGNPSPLKSTNCAINKSLLFLFYYRRENNKEAP